jgi:cation diffusion facilitator family transporter
MAKAEGIDRTAIVRRAALIALVGNLFLAALKIVTGLTAGSLAVLGDGLDSSTDVAIAIMTLAVGFIINQPSDKEHPWGHHRAETIGTIVLAFIIMFAGFQLFESAVRQLRSGNVTKTPGLIALAVTAVSIAGKLILALTQYRLGKKSGSAMILANAKNMTNDIIISLSVFVGLGAATIFKMPALDAITALLVSLWVMKSAVGIFREQNLELMDGNADDELYRTLFEAVHSVEGAGTSTSISRWREISPCARRTTSPSASRRPCGTRSPTSTTSWCTSSPRATASTMNNTGSPRRTSLR